MIEKITGSPCRSEQEDTENTYIAYLIYLHEIKAERPLTEQESYALRECVDGLREMGRDPETILKSHS